MKQLEKILFFEKEVLKENSIYISVEKVYLKDENEIREMIRENESIRDTSLLVASTDTAIALGKELGIATMAYANPNFPNQTYSGVDMVVEGFDEIDEDFLEKVFQRYHHIPWTILETERCVVREITLADIDDLFELYGSDGIDEFTEPLYEYEEEKEFQRAYIEHMYRFFGYGMWLVFEKASGKLIGRAGLEHREIHDETELELGYLIGTNYQGKGYATEVCKAIINYAAKNTYFEQINCVVQQGNDVSVHMAEKLGFSYVESFDLDGKIMLRFVRELA